MNNRHSFFKIYQCALSIYVLFWSTHIFAIDTSARAAENYAMHCMGCHQMDGGGMPPIIPKLSGEVSRFLSVPGGRAYLISVPGASMAPISDAELADVMNWLLVEYDTPNIPAGFIPYSVREVQEHRRPALADPLRTRQILLARIRSVVGTNINHVRKPHVQ